MGLASTGEHLPSVHRPRGQCPALHDNNTKLDQTEKVIEYFTNKLRFILKKTSILDFSVIKRKLNFPM